MVVPRMPREIEENYQRMTNKNLKDIEAWAAWAALNYFSSQWSELTLKISFRTLHPYGKKVVLLKYMQLLNNCFFIPGCWACFVFLEQRVHHVSDWGKQSSYHAHHVPCPISHLQGALEPDHCGPRIQRTQNLHGNELKAVWWPHCFIQGWKAKVSIWGFNLQFRNCHSFT